jgi:hypothetical protein
MEKIKVPASTADIQPIFADHIRMNMGANGNFFFDFRTVVPDYSGTTIKPEDLEGKNIHIDFDEKLTPPHTRIILPAEAVLSLREMLIRAFETVENEANEPKK